MFTNVSNGNYTAKIIRIGTVFPIEGADNICRIVVDHQNVVVGKDTQEGEVRIFFPAECQISHKLLSNLNEYRVSSSGDNLNADLKASGGFFESHRRVKPIRLRGIKSVGYTIPASDFAKVFGLDVKTIEIRVNDYFDHVNGEMVCNKYVAPIKVVGNQKTGKQTPKLTRLVEGQFNFHIKTSNIRRDMAELSKKDSIVISNKLHGSSWIVSNVLVKTKLNLISRIAKWMGVSVKETEYDHLASSRKVVRNRFLEDPKAKNKGYYDVDFWTLIKEEIKESVPKGYSVFGEIVGYVPRGEKMIQKGYDYGCAPGEYKLSVYRVTYTNSEGIVVDLSNYQVETFCEKYGFTMSEKFFEGTVQEFLNKYDLGTDHWQENMIAKMEELYNEKNCKLCTHHKVPEEGVVIRVVNRPSFTAYKLKSFKFIERESKDNDSGEENIEDAN